MLGWLKRLFTRKTNLIEFDPTRPTIPEAFGYPEPEYDQLVREMTKFIYTDNTLISLDAYLRGPLFTKYHLDLNNPQHAAILGYAFCSAVFIQRSAQMQTAAESVLAKFYPRPTEKTVN